MVPNWVEDALNGDLPDEEEIVETEELESGKLAVATTKKRGYVLKDRMFRGPKVWSFELEVPAGVEELGGMETTTEPLPDAAEPEAEPSTSEPDTEPEEPTETQPEPTPQTGNELERLTGIGPQRTKRLEDAGIQDLQALQEADPETIQDALNVSPSTVETWKHETDLTSVHGIGAQRTKRLRDAGILTLTDLVDADPEALAERLDTSTSTVEDWQQDADHTQAPIEELTAIDGIGETRARDLLDQGIDTLEALVQADPDAVTDFLGVSEDTLVRWQREAVEHPQLDTDLLDVDGIGNARARDLIRLGLPTRAAFTDADPAKVAEGLGVSEDTVTRWQADAGQD